MPNDEILKLVFPLLEGVDLVTCSSVCKQWREIARDDYFWKCLCAKKWPSTCKKSSPLTSSSYQKLYKTFHKRRHVRPLPPPRLSLDDLEFYIDIWAEQNLIFSEVVPGPILRKGNWAPPNGLPDVLRFHLLSPEYKMAMPVHPRFSVTVGQAVIVSVLVGRKDSGKIARVIDRAVFEYIDRSTYRAMAFDYLDFSPEHPFVSGIRAWASLLFTDQCGEGDIDVFGIELDFCDAASSEDQVLWLLDMLDWK
ncbi:F-box protein [Striga hermonthica]|uniref:F-box protein n=1 Tax=Striga hermonthica TaxID=68872 RepID=A0A9N7NDF5_STRHE|nr:F-box protein [Striga hermonthica]